MAVARVGIDEQLALTVVRLYDLDFLAAEAAPTSLIEQAEVNALHAFDDLLAMIAGEEPIWRYRSDSERGLLERLQALARRVLDRN